MADRFYVLNSGNTNDTGHWSLTTGGASGASVPNNSINAKWDSNSFSSAGQTTTVNAILDCLDMDWTGVTNNPTFAVNSNINFYGSLTFVPGMSFSGSATVSFVSPVTGKTITMAGKTFGNSVAFNAAGGGWTLQDAFSASGNVVLFSGSIDTNGKTASCATFNGSGTGARSLSLGSSVITCTAWTFTTTTGLTFSGGTSTINMTASATFAGGGLTYYHVAFTGTTTTITGSNTFNQLTLNAGKTTKFTSGTTQSVSSIVANGSAGNLITIQSATPGSAATISKSSGIVYLDYCTITDMTFTGGATFIATNSIDGGGNSGIIFGYPHKVMGQITSKVNGILPTKVNGV